MKRFEYEITKHFAGEFLQLVYFCTDEGECKVDELPDEQIKTLGKILNERGAEGWELISLYPGKDGVVVFWKKAIDIPEH